MEEEDAGESGPGHGCFFSETSAAPVCGAGQGDAPYNQSLSTSPALPMSSGKAMGEGKVPSPSHSVLPSPRASPNPGLQQRLRERGSKPRAQQQREGERERLAD